MGEMSGSISQGAVAAFHDFELDRVANPDLAKFIDSSTSPLNVALMMPAYLPKEVAEDRSKAKKPLQDYIEDYVNQEMASEIAKYNTKQRRKDRKLLDEFGNDMKYMDYAKSNNNLKDQKLIMEHVIQLGSHDDLGAKWHKAIVSGDKKAIKTIHEAYTAKYSLILEEFKDQNKHQQVVGAVIHFDEHNNGTPHMHIQTMPIGEYDAKASRGMKLSKAICFTKALENDGYGSRADGYSLTSFYEKMREEIIKPKVIELADELEPHLQGYHRLKAPKHGVKHEAVAQRRAKVLENEKLHKEKLDLMAQKLHLETDIADLKANKDELIEQAKDELEDALIELTDSTEAIDKYKEAAFKDPEVIALAEDKAKTIHRKAMDASEVVLDKYFNQIQTPKAPDAGPEI